MPKSMSTVNFKAFQNFLKSLNSSETEVELEAKVIDEPLVTCTSPFNEVSVVDETGDIKPNTCPGNGFVGFCLLIKRI